eukprot:TRINITY_DN9479_c3_g1_i1.p1 TRINITY_DN9479_c3_g1~~TRINITY_DN9479_c3_g1_i1.p1  ORF type:complete len:558 (-),score=76.75 TRINITY_DN9479_c3_g1_i1:85-1758(-)
MASEAKTSAWRPRLAIVDIARLFYGEWDVSSKEYVHAYFPTTYLAAMHELTALAFVTDRIMPLLFPSLNDHGKFDYHAEVGIASISMIFSSFNVGLAWRYWWLSNARSNILAEPPTCALLFNKFTVVVLALSSNVALCLWLIPNKTTPTLPAEIPTWTIYAIGRLIIGLYAITLYAAYMGNLFETQRIEAIKMRDKVFAGIYGFFAIYLVCAYSFQEDNWSVQVALFFWAVCLLLVYSFMPQEQPVVQTIGVALTNEEIVGTEQAMRQSPQNCNCPPCLEWFSIVKLLNSPLDARLIYPKYFLGATHEVFGLTLLITWSLTLAIPALRPQVFDHPARVIIGSYNPCFGWDYFPASWISVYCCSFNVYFSYRYAWLANLRRALLRQAYSEPETFGSTVSTYASYALGLSSNLWLCLWLLGPNPEDPLGDLDGPEIFWWSVHTFIFVFMAGSEYFTYLGLLLDIGMGPRSEVVTTKQKIFALVYGYCCGYLLFVYGYNLAFHDKGSGVPALGSGFWTQISDIMWMACVISISNFLPDEPPLKQKNEVPQTSLPLQETAA